MEPVAYRSGNYNDQNSGNLDPSWDFRKHSMHFLLVIKVMNVEIPNQEERNGTEKPDVYCQFKNGIVVEVL